MKPQSEQDSCVFSTIRWILFRGSLWGLLSVLLAACTSATAPPLTPILPPLAKELVFYDWEENMPQSVLDEFTEQYGVKIKYVAYESQEEAIANLRASRIYDVVVMESRFVPLLAQEGILSDLNHKHLPNLRNISANFRELAYDPNNLRSVPDNWGTTGPVARSNLVEEPVAHWTDLWGPHYAGRVGLWMGQPREVISLTLKSLGYSANSENPDELEEALQKIEPDILNNRIIFPSSEDLVNAELILPLTPAGQRLYDKIWELFSGAP